MKYLLETALKDRKGKEIKVQIPGEEDKELTTGLYIYLMAESYVPSPQVLVLNNGERRKLDKIQDKLEKDPNEKSYWEFQEDEWELIKKVFNVWVQYVPLLSKHSSHMEDMIEEIKNKME